MRHARSKSPRPAREKFGKEGVNGAIDSRRRQHRANRVLEFVAHSLDFTEVDSTAKVLIAKDGGVAEVEWELELLLGDDKGAARPKRVSDSELIQSAGVRGRQIDHDQVCFEQLPVERRFDHPCVDYFVSTDAFEAGQLHRGLDPHPVALV